MNFFNFFFGRLFFCHFLLYFSTFHSTYLLFLWSPVYPNWKLWLNYAKIIRMDKNLPLHTTLFHKKRKKRQILGMERKKLLSTDFILFSCLASVFSVNCQYTMTCVSISTVRSILHFCFIFHCARILTFFAFCWCLFSILRNLKLQTENNIKHTFISIIRICIFVSRCSYRMNSWSILVFYLRLTFDSWYGCTNGFHIYYVWQ